MFCHALQHDCAVNDLGLTSHVSFLTSSLYHLVPDNFHQVGLVVLANQYLVLYIFEPEQVAFDAGDPGNGNNIGFMNP